MHAAIPRIGQSSSGCPLDDQAAERSSGDEHRRNRPAAGCREIGQETLCSNESENDPGEPGFDGVGVEEMIVSSSRKHGEAVGGLRPVESRDRI